MKDVIIEMRNSILKRIESYELTEDQLKEIRKDFKDFSREISTEVKILNCEVEKNEQYIKALTKSHSDLRSYVVAAIENRDDYSWFQETKTPLYRRIAPAVSSFCNNHGPVIAYTLLSCGLTSFLTYYIVTRII